MSLRSQMRTLYRGESSIQFIGHRKRWYLVSVVLLLICLFSFVVRGFNIGIEFEGGTQFQIEKSSSITAAQAEKAFEDAGVTPAEPAQRVGSGGDRSILVKTRTLTLEEQTAAKDAAAKTLNRSISVTSVSSSWGSDVTDKAIQGLIAFLIIVSIYIAIRFQPRMAVGAIIALFHDLIVAAGVYSIIGFEVTPSTVVGLLTILGFSLYDTVVVYDKVAENSRDLLAGSRTTFSDAANSAVNQTLMRSINTSLIALLPVAGLLFVGAGLLGVGTIKDLALILFVGLASGAYSSLFLATPIVVDLTERQPAYQALTKRVLAKRAAEATRAAAPELVKAGPARRASGPAPAPRPGARPAQRPRRR